MVNKKTCGRKTCGKYAKSISKKILISKILCTFWKKNLSPCIPGGHGPNGYLPWSIDLHHRVEK